MAWKVNIKLSCALSRQQWNQATPPLILPTLTTIWGSDWSWVRQELMYPWRMDLFSLNTTKYLLSPCTTSSLCFFPSDRKNKPWCLWKHYNLHHCKKKKKKNPEPSHARHLLQALNSPLCPPALMMRGFSALSDLSAFHLQLISVCLKLVRCHKFSTQS